MIIRYTNYLFQFSFVGISLEQVAHPLRKKWLRGTVKNDERDKQYDEMKVSVIGLYESEGRGRV
jgi:hypothetical protein